MKGSCEIEVRQHRAVILHIEMDEWRIQAKQEQAVANREGVVKDAITSPYNNVFQRQPGEPKSWTEIVVVGLVQPLGRFYDLAGRRIEVRHEIVSFTKWRLIVIPHSGVQREAAKRLPFMLNVEARCPCPEISCRISSQAQCVGRKAEQQICQRVPGINAAGELILAAAVEIE